MKSKILFFALLVILLPMAAMDSSSCSDDSKEEMHKSESTDSASYDGPKLTFQEEVQKLAKIVHEIPYEIVEEADDYERKKELTILYNAYNTYKNLRYSAEVIDGQFKLSSLNSRVDHDKITSKRLIAATWLQLVSPDHKEWFKTNMLHWATETGHVGTVRYLIKKEEVGVNQPNLVGEIPLYTACQNGNEKIVAYLLAHGALDEKETRKVYYENAFRKAQNYRRDAIAEKLEEYMKEQNDNRRVPLVNKKCVIN